ncbi:hypothetical protein [Enterocloster clostridioformis]|nr:hypothetical protein [Enterocloster clostridioformis]MCD7870022.1 hypothetical protein [Enterocloster clostridioformis]MDB2127302.1 hypothetical protein [Enterocloster clostridioformis]MDU1960394.1 hypothetical protein [Enterocloster clostridioformis]
MILTGMEDGVACGQGFHGRFSRRGFPGTDGEHGAEARRRGGRMGGRNPL